MEARIRMDELEITGKNIVTYARKVLSDKGDGYSRSYSWDYCYSRFYRAFEKIDQNNADTTIIDDDQRDYLALNLAFYLASWGMYRGSSFLLKRDYKIHKKAVDKILDHYELYKCDADSYKSYAKSLGDLIYELRSYYKSVRESVYDNGEVKRYDKVMNKYMPVACPSSSISDTLISKIILGAFGCVPAYDTYFIGAVKQAHGLMGSSVLNISNIEKLYKFYNSSENLDSFEGYRRGLRVKDTDIPYPQMKLVDIGMWGIGEELSE